MKMYTNLAFQPTKILTVPVLFILVILISFSPQMASSQLTRNEAIEFLISEVIESSPNKDVLMAFGPQDVLLPGTVVVPFDTETEPFPGNPRTIQTETWFFWIDDEPDAKFVHPTRFVYIDTNNPNPSIGDGIVFEVQGWWPTINGISHYEDFVERVNSPEVVYGSPPTPTKPRGVRPSIPREFLLSSGKKGAIVVSGSGGASFKGDIKDMKDALKNSDTGPGIAEADILTKENASKADIENFITQMNNKNVETLYIHLSSHGGKERIRLSDGVISSENLEKVFKKSNAKKIYITLDACYVGSFINEMKESLKVNGKVLTSTDENHTSKAWRYTDGSDGNSYFVEDLTTYLKDPKTDTNGDGKVDYNEAYARLKKEGRPKTLYGKPKEEHLRGLKVPTLSEWGLILMTLLLLTAATWMLWRRRKVTAA